MQFVDQAQILVRGGAGGNGCSALFTPPGSRHPFRMGGDGGDGGDVVLLADPQLATLLDFQFRHEFKAGRVAHGTGNTKTGRRGEACLVRIPVGTLVVDADLGAQLRDFVVPYERLTVAHGGRGGAGNARVRNATPGRPGEEKRLRLELKLIADVGLIGFPNAGKSSLLARISTARPKIAAYPFTTTSPVLGIVSAGEEGSFAACDIPGLIEGAHTGRGMGMQFLRHIERTRLLVHIVDLAGVDGRDPIQDVAAINAELAAYSQVLAARPQIIAANKLDLPEAQARLAAFKAAMGGAPVVELSCVTGKGLPELIRALQRRLVKMREEDLSVELS